MKVIYEEGLTKTQKNKAKDIIAFLERKLHLGISKGTNYRHNVVVEFDYNKAQFKVKKGDLDQ